MHAIGSKPIVIRLLFFSFTKNKQGAKYVIIQYPTDMFDILFPSCYICLTFIESSTTNALISLCFNSAFQFFCNCMYHTTNSIPLSSKELRYWTEYQIIFILFNYTKRIKLKTDLKVRCLQLKGSTSQF